MRRGRIALVWASLAVAIIVPIAAAATSPLLAWRGPVYILAGFAGVIALALLLPQPLLAAGGLPGLSPLTARRLHRGIGGVLVLAVVVHVAALWITSPPDVIDALLFASPTPFSVWGVTAMWALFAVVPLVMLRRKVSQTLGPRLWQRAHMALGLVIVLASVVHALLIDGTMETVSKAALGLLVVAATLGALWRVGAKSR
jgi:hypothetical protein